MKKQNNTIDNNEHCCSECLYFRMDPPKFRLVCNKNSLRILCGIFHMNDCGDFESKHQAEDKTK